MKVTRRRPKKRQKPKKPANPLSNNVTMDLRLFLGRSRRMRAIRNTSRRGVLPGMTCGDLTPTFSGRITGRKMERTTRERGQAGTPDPEMADE
jgi:hypothetical protein